MVRRLQPTLGLTLFNGLLDLTEHIKGQRAISKGVAIHSDVVGVDLPPRARSAVVVAKHMDALTDHWLVSQIVQMRASSSIPVWLSSNAPLLSRTRPI